MHVWALGLSCETPTASGPPDVHFRGSQRFKHHQNSTGRPPEKETKRTNMGAGEGKKARNFGPPPFGAPPFGTHPAKLQPSAYVCWCQCVCVGVGVGVGVFFVCVGVGVAVFVCGWVGVCVFVCVLVCVFVFVCDGAGPKSVF